jgi:transcriptional regulator with XRE-family HTH domain
VGVLETNNDTILIGQRIRAARQAKGMSQADLAFDADISLPHISNFELGKKQLSILTFRKIIEVLGVSADEILRPNIPEVKRIYQDEFSQILQDCTPDEIESILNIVKEIKHSLHSKHNDED